MKVNIRLEKGCKEPHVEIFTDTVTDDVKSLADRIANLSTSTLTVYRDDEAFILHQENIIRFYTESKKTYAETNDGTFMVKQPLCKIEEELSEDLFIRVSQSEIVSLGNIESMSIDIMGTVTVRLDNGTSSVVSRRNVTSIKNALEIKGKVRHS